VTAGSAAAVVVLAYVLPAVRIGRLEARKAFIEREMAPIRELAGELESKKRRIRMIQSQLSDRSLPLEVLGELYQRVPEGLNLSHLAMDLNPAGPQLTMKGPAGSLEAAFGFPMVLEESPLFYDVRPDAAQQVSRGKGVLIEFGCRCRVTGSRPAVKE
jgi:Tfp pilus assembly protein PilN